MRTRAVNDKTLQHVCLIEELIVAIGLLKGGLRELQHIDSANDFYHLPLLILASGFERLMKVIICFHIYETKGSYPSKLPWMEGKRHGHDLMWLLDYITKKCFSSSYLKRIPAAYQDITFLREDKHIRTVIKILSDFGDATRYYNLKVVSGNKPDTGSPEQQWNKLETEIMRDSAEWAIELRRSSGLADTFGRINTEIVARLERFARALCRLFTIGALGAKALQASSVVHEFLMIRDDMLGNTRY